MEQIFDQIRRYIDGNRKPMLSLWEELVNTESGSRQLDGVTAVCNILRRELEGTGAKTRVIPMENAGDVLIGEWNSESTKAPLLFIGHMDTVFKEGAATENPFRIDAVSYTHLDVYKRQILSSNCSSISRWDTALHCSSRRSASVDLPWSMCAIMEKLRICSRFFTPKAPYLFHNSNMEIL